MYTYYLKRAQLGPFLILQKVLDNNENCVYEDKDLFKEPMNGLEYILFDVCNNWAIKNP